MKVYCQDCKFLADTIGWTYCCNEQAGSIYVDTPFSRRPNNNNFLIFNQNNACTYYEKGKPDDKFFDAMQKKYFE